MTRNSDFEYLYEVGRIRSTVFQIGTRADPSINKPESFAVILFFELSDGTVVEVAKVDNAEHDEGTVHVDRYYRDVGADIKDFNVDVDGLWEGEAYLEQHWQQFAQTHLDNHGRAARDNSLCRRGEATTLRAWSPTTPPYFAHPDGFAR